MPFVPTQKLLLKSARILRRYCGLGAGIRQTLGLGQYSMTHEVRQFIHAITVHKSIETLTQFTEALLALERSIPEGDSLGVHINSVRDYIARNLNAINRQDFSPVSMMNNADLIVHIYFQESQQVWEMLAFLDATKSDSIISKLCEDDCLKPIIWDFPEKNSLLKFEYAERAIGAIFHSIFWKELPLHLLLDRLQNLPWAQGKSAWLLARDPGRGENLVSLTLQYAPERFNDLLSWLDELDPRSLAMVLLYSDRHKKMNLIDRAAQIHDLAAMYKLLVKILSLPDKTCVELFLKETLRMVCHSHVPNMDSDIPRKALLLLEAVVSLPELTQVIEIIDMPGTDFKGKNMIAYAARYSVPMFRCLLSFVAALKEDDLRCYFMEQIFNNARQYFNQSTVLIEFVAKNTQLHDTWLFFETKSHWNLLAIAAKHRLESSELITQSLHYKGENRGLQNRFMKQLVNQSIVYADQAYALIRFILKNPGIHDQWLSYAGRKGWNLLHIAALHKNETSGQILSLLQAIQSRLAKEQFELMMAQKNEDHNTPLMVAARFSPGAIEALVAFVLECSNAQTILRTINLTGDTAFSLASNGQNKANSRSIYQALKKTSSSIGYPRFMVREGGEDLDEGSSFQNEDRCLERSPSS